MVTVGHTFPSIEWHLWRLNHTVPQVLYFVRFSNQTEITNSWTLILSGRIIKAKLFFGLEARLDDI